MSEPCSSGMEHIAKLQSEVFMGWQLFQGVGRTTPEEDYSLDAIIKGARELKKVVEKFGIPYRQVIVDEPICSLIPKGFIWLLPDQIIVGNKEEMEDEVHDHM